MQDNCSMDVSMEPMKHPLDPPLKTHKYSHSNWMLWAGQLYRGTTTLLIKAIG